MVDRPVMIFLSGSRSSASSRRRIAACRSRRMRSRSLACCGPRTRSADRDSSGCMALTSTAPNPGTLPDRSDLAVGVLPDRGPLPRLRDTRLAEVVAVPRDPELAAEGVVEVERRVDDRASPSARAWRAPVAPSSPRRPPTSSAGPRLAPRGPPGPASAPCRRAGSPRARGSAWPPWRRRRRRAGRSGRHPRGPRPASLADPLAVGVVDHGLALGGLDVPPPQPRVLRLAQVDLAGLVVAGVDAVEHPLRRVRRPRTRSARSTRSTRSRARACRSRPDDPDRACGGPSAGTGRWGSGPAAASGPSRGSSGRSPARGTGRPGSGRLGRELPVVDRGRRGCARVPVPAVLGRYQAANPMARSTLTLRWWSPARGRRRRPLRACVRGGRDPSGAVRALVDVRV